ncbi:hypothetical protein [Pectinatus frisingensis]|uniref:hypothetical protein n=1 Tax=Pectinatus frisingensis TaxID=865 RepID=UPI0018C7673D|nr:hypothetical protein [Pectinatus frisingensis]
MNKGYIIENADGTIIYTEDADELQDIVLSMKNAEDLLSTSTKSRAEANRIIQAAYIAAEIAYSNDPNIAMPPKINGPKYGIKINLPDGHKLLEQNQ